MYDKCIYAVSGAMYKKKFKYDSLPDETSSIQFLFKLLIENQIKIGSYSIYVKMEMGV